MQHIVRIYTYEAIYKKECDYMPNITVNNENFKRCWNLIQATFFLNNVEEVTPNPEEIAALNAYHSGDPDYQPAMSQEEVLKELGL